MEEFFNALQGTLGEAMPGLLGALIILVIGWIIALIGKTLVRKGLEVLNINKLVKNRMNLEKGAAKLVYYIILLVTLLAVFNALNLQMVSEPIQNLLNAFFDFLPKLIAGAVLIIIAWLFARIASEVAASALQASGVDSKVSHTPGSTTFSKTMGNVVYGLVLILFLPAVLGVFDIQGLIQPAQGMIDKILGFLPNILAAVLIGAVGWFIAKILHDVVANLLMAAGLDKAGEKVGLQGSMALSKVVGLVVYIFVLLPAIISALNALRMEAVSGPATDMLATVLNILPNAIAAVVILMLTYMIAKVVARLIVNLLSGVGFDDIPGKLGLKLSRGITASAFAGNLFIFFMMLFATVEAASRVGFAQVSELVAFFIQFGGQVLLGAVIIAIGLWIANLVHGSISRSGGASAAWVAGLVRLVILGLVLAMGLRSMGLANDIINMAFGLTLGSAAIAVALAFGLGGRDAASDIAKRWVAKLK